jgi:hypothetical protein
MRSQESGASNIVDGDVVLRESIPRNWFIEQASRHIQQTRHELRQ